MKKFLMAGLVSLALSAASFQTYAQDAALQRGAEKAKAICASCHEANGISKIPSFPKLAGQHQDYLREALLSYQRGSRKNVIMKGQAAALSKQDIDDLAAYYSHQPNGLSHE
ncbi:MAG: cytochrome c [Pseudomonadota bacterium]